MNMRTYTKILTKSTQDELRQMERNLAYEIAICRTAERDVTYSARNRRLAASKGRYMNAVQKELHRRSES